MIKTAEATGKTIDAARAAACRALGIAEDEGSMEILTLPKSGFLGIGAVAAKVRVTLELPEEPKPAAAQRAPRAAAESRREPKAPYVPHAAAAYAPDSREERIDSFLRGLLERMDIQADILITPRESGGLNVELAGPNMGAVIGRRGETLDAIQHLTNYALNRGGERHMHISVDAEAYRSKREDSLVHLAEKMAAKAIKYKRSMALEPMNSYERHVIHSALQDYEGVTTSSIGTDPNRRVVVTIAGSESPVGRREHSEHSDRRSRDRDRSRAPRAPRADAAPWETAAPAEETPPVSAPAAPVPEAPAPVAPKPETPVPEAPKPVAPAPAAPAPVKAPLPPDFPEGYEPPTKNKPSSREWC